MAGLLRLIEISVVYTHIDSHPKEQHGRAPAIKNRRTLQISTPRYLLRLLPRVAYGAENHHSQTLAKRALLCSFTDRPPRHLPHEIRRPGPPRHRPWRTQGNGRQRRRWLRALPDNGGRKHRAVGIPRRHTEEPGAATSPGGAAAKPPSYKP